MASDERGGKTGGAGREPGARFVGGPRAIGTLLPGVTRAAFRARSAASAQIIAGWPEIVGAALADVTQPERLTAGTLTLACAGPVALELQHLAGPLAERINAHFGRVLVQRFRFVQKMLPPAGLPGRSRRVAPAAVDIADMAPGPLRDALAALGGLIAAARSREGA